MTNCCLIDFEGMLRMALKIGNAEVESPSPSNCSLGSISQIINVASSQYGVAQQTGSDEVLVLFKKNYQNT